MKVFVAGGTGVVGKRLVPLLVKSGYEVVATTRSADRVGWLRGVGAEPVVIDGLHDDAVKEAVERAEPEVVIHQMSGLSGAKDFKRFDAEFAATNRLRTQGTDHLLAGAKAAGVARFIAQSFGNWNYERTGSGPKTEQDLLDPDPPAEPARPGRALRADDPGCARLVGRGGHRPATQWYRSGRL
jgi:2-alkyl-3-oxoalkanoate reductase